MSFLQSVVNRFILKMLYSDKNEIHRDLVKVIEDNEIDQYLGTSSAVIANVLTAKLVEMAQERR